VCIGAAQLVALKLEPAQAAPEVPSAIDLQ
jgi:hypothetical protein